MTKLQKILAAGLVVLAGCVGYAEGATKRLSTPVNGLRFNGSSATKPDDCVSGTECLWVDSTNLDLHYYVDGAEVMSIDVFGSITTTDVTLRAAQFSGRISATTSAWSITDPGAAGAIPVSANGVCSMTSGGSGQTRTIAAPAYVGQEISLAMNVDGGGDIVVTVASAYDQSAHTTITMNDAGDYVQLKAVLIGGARRWRLVVNDGCTLG